MKKIIAVTLFALASQVQADPFSSFIRSKLAEHGAKGLASGSHQVRIIPGPNGTRTTVIQPTPAWKAKTDRATRRRPSKAQRLVAEVVRLRRKVASLESRLARLEHLAERLQGHVD